MDCKAELHIADDYGDNHATMRCQLQEGHEGPHEERFERNGEVVLTWVCDEREPDSAPKSDPFYEDGGIGHDLAI